MTTNVGALIPELWSKRIQLSLKRKTIAFEIGNLEERATLSYGDTVHRPIMADDFIANDIDRGTDHVEQPINTSDEFLTINHQKEITSYIDLFDQKQSPYSILKAWSRRTSNRLANDIDQNFLSEYLNGKFTVDDGGTPYTVTKDNVVSIILKAKAMLAAGDVEDDVPRILVATPFFIEAYENAVITNGFQTADAALKNGYVGNVNVFKVYQSNNLPHIATLTGTPANTNTVTINGVTLTFKTTAAAAGDVTVGANIDASIANLNAVIQGTATGAGAFDPVADKAKIAALRNVNALAFNNGGKVGILTGGYVLVTVTGFTAVATLAYQGFGQRGTIDFVPQIAPTVQFNKAPKRSGHYAIIMDLYGIKSFQEGINRMGKIVCVAG